MRSCCYCGQESVESEMEGRVKVSVGEDLFFCSGLCAKEVMTRIADAFRLRIVVEGYNDR